ncbi:hypothetical protein [Dermabacter sp. HMSC08H10]|uniref:hypothetical protein n=1 Tax=Dermabacter sp. HMSC08H10 TaxID=1581144 RepID=UPI00114D23FF|nr:hypothetical protein [Dermabacter sp. HMSC08H10]
MSLTTLAKFKAIISSFWKFYAHTRNSQEKAPLTNTTTQEGPTTRRKLHAGRNIERLRENSGIKLREKSGYIAQKIREKSGYFPKQTIQTVTTTNTHTQTTATHKHADNTRSEDETTCQRRRGGAAKTTNATRLRGYEADTKFPRSCFQNFHRAALHSLHSNTFPFLNFASEQFSPYEKAASKFQGASKRKKVKTFLLFLREK